MKTKIVSKRRLLGQTGSFSKIDLVQASTAGLYRISVYSQLDSDPLGSNVVVYGVWKDIHEVNDENSPSSEIMTVDSSASYSEGTKTIFSDEGELISIIGIESGSPNAYTYRLDIVIEQLA